MANFDFHHLIPNSLSGHPVFTALGSSFQRFTLKLPNKNGAALSGDRALMEARHASHIADYNDAIQAYLDRFQQLHLNPTTGQLNPSVFD